MGFLSDTWGALSGSTRAEGAQRSGEAERAGIQEGQDYLMERDELGNRVGDQALTGLSDYYQGDQQGTIDRAMNSPLYAQMMQAKEDAGEQTMRNASATGSLRGGNVQSDMYKNNLRFDKEALTTTVDQQLEGLGNLTGQRDRQTGNIAQLYGDKGRSFANQYATEASAKGDLLSNGLQIAGTVGSFFSDPRLKESIEFVDEINGHNIYRWKWNDFAKKLGLEGDEVGVLAHEVPIEATGQSEGFLTVDYEALGLNHHVLNSLEMN